MKRRERRRESCLTEFPDPGKSEQAPSDASGGALHPVTGLLWVLVGAFCAGSGSRSLLWVSVCMSMAAYVVTGIRPSRALLYSFKRLRWLLLSVFAIYGWYAPGDPLAHSLGVLSPSLQGTIEALYRCGGLLIIVSFVHWLFRRWAVEELIGAVIWLLSSVISSRDFREKAAVRMMLTLRAVQSAPPPIAHAQLVRDNVWSAWADKATEMYLHALDRAHVSEETLSVLRIQIPHPPPMAQALGLMVLVVGVLLSCIA